MTRKTCLVADCIDPPKVGEYCTKHYQRWRGKQRLTLEQRWTSAFRRAVRSSGLSFAAIAERVQLNVRLPARYFKGTLIPGHATVVRLGEALESEEIVTLSLQLRMRKCPVCDHAFVGHGNRRFCTSSCLVTDISRRDRESKANENAIVRHRFARYQRAVVAHCGSCEPEGICRDDTCALRPVSPLPFVPLHTVLRRSAA